MSASRPPTEREIQEELLRLDAYRSQLNALLQQHQYLSASYTDHQRARASLEGMEATEAHPELLLPIGGETYLRGTAEASSKVIIGVGSGVAVEMERAKATEVLAERLTRIERARKELEGQIGQLEERIEALSQRLDAVSRDRSDRADDVGRD